MFANKCPSYNNAAIFMSASFAPEKTELHLLVMGKAGVSKRTLVTGLFGSSKGRETCPEVDITLLPPGVSCTIFSSTSTTTTPTSSSEDDFSIKVSVWHYPRPHSLERALKGMKEALAQLDLVLFALRMDDTRLRPEDVDMIQRLSKHCGDLVWSKAMFLFTYANR